MQISHSSDAVHYSGRVDGFSVEATAYWPSYEAPGLGWHEPTGVGFPKAFAVTVSDPKERLDIEMSVLIAVPAAVALIRTGKLPPTRSPRVLDFTIRARPEKNGLRRARTVSDLRALPLARYLRAACRAVATRFIPGETVAHQRPGVTYDLRAASPRDAERAVDDLYSRGRHRSREPVDPTRLRRIARWYREGLEAKQAGKIRSIHSHILDRAEAAAGGYVGDEGYMRQLVVRARKELDRKTGKPYLGATTERRAGEKAKRR